MPGLMRQLSAEWKVVGIVLLAGACLGWKVAANRLSNVYAASPSVKTQVIVFPHTSTVAAVYVPAPVSRDEQQAVELKRLKTRTRRLEALVKVLQERQQQSGGLEAKR